MRFMLICLFALIGLVPAAAQDAYPDMLGTWTGTADRVVSNAEGTIQFRSDPLTIEFTEQRDRRFVGHLLVEDEKIQIVGIFLDPKTFRWAESGGFADGRLMDPDTFEACYLRLAEFSKIAACETMTRDR